MAVKPTDRGAIIDRIEQRALKNPVHGVRLNQLETQILNGLVSTSVGGSARHRYKHTRIMQWVQEAREELVERIAEKITGVSRYDIDAPAEFTSNL